MNKKLQIIGATTSLALLAGWGIFWLLQLIDVLEFLEMAYG